MLQERQRKADLIMKKDLLKLMDKEHNAIFDLDVLNIEISRIEYRNKLA